MVEKRRTERSLWIALLELFLIFIGFLGELPTALLVAFVVLLYFVLATSFKLPNFAGLSFRRRISRDRISDENEITVEETIRNEEPVPVFLEVLSRIPPEIAVSEGSNHYVAYVRGKESNRIRYKIKPMYTGNFKFQKTSLRALNQLATPHEEVERELPTAFSVYPVLEEVKRFPFGRMSVRPIQGVIRSKAPGRGTDFFEIRDYGPGDEFKRINWKASARTGMLLSNEYDWERMADIYMVLDSTSSSAYFLRDYVRTCVALIDFFLRMGNRVGLVVIGKFWNWVRSGSGRRQLVRLVDNLIEERPGDPLTLSYHVENTMRVIPQVSTVILLSSLRDDRMRELAERMMARRQRIMAVMPSATTVSLKASRVDTPWAALAKELVKLERGNALKFLKQIYLPAIEWDPRMPISDTAEVLQRWAGRKPINSTLTQ
jgi:uncharacterized protein (DUF58 family)